MNYENWAKEYLNDSMKVKKAIDREKKNLEKSTKFEETQAINRRIQILRSMYYECKLTARLLQSRAGDKVVGDEVA